MRHAKDHPLYEVWFAMLQRSNRKIKQCYQHVEVYEPWKERYVPRRKGPSPGLLCFAEYIEKNLGPCNGRSLDRIDGNKGYEPGNIRWATREEQNKNRRLGWLKPTQTPSGRLPWAHPHKYGWQARFSLGGVIYSAGVYNTQEEAHEKARIKREEILNSITYKLP
jgi:hypothetical protein